MLWTVREFKKVRLRYFTDDYAAWEEYAFGRMLPKAAMSLRD